MRILRCTFVAGAALLVGLGFAVLSENLVLAVVPVASILVLAGYLSLERRVLGPPTPGTRRRRTRSVRSGVPYAGSTDGGSSAGGDCGFGGDGGGFGGDGGGGGGC